jgi:L-alanine-DL-glutamate epimerase-like enolase superfamily enzyme
MSSSLLEMSVIIERYAIAGRFTISRGSRTHVDVVFVTLSQNGFTGRGECVPYARYNETPQSVMAQIEAVRCDLINGLDRITLQSHLKAGAARNALDCAFWDLEAKQTRIPVYHRLGDAQPAPVTTAYTLSLNTPQAMGEAARLSAHRPLLKIKLGSSSEDRERLMRVRENAPHAKLIVDANEGWTIDTLEPCLRACIEANVALIEQPVPAGHEALLKNVERMIPMIPLCADESVHDRASLMKIAPFYDMINIKLDKTGGLTEALLLADEAHKLGLDIMIGCMVGTSLAMAPALLLASRARFIDLDGPLLLTHDRIYGLRYEGSTIFPAEPQLWG